MLDCGYRLDLVVEDQVIIEIKSVSAIAPIHEAQLLSYLRLYGACTRGLLINFNVKRLVEGIRRMTILTLSVFSVGSPVTWCKQLIFRHLQNHVFGNCLGKLQLIM